METFLKNIFPSIVRNTLKFYSEDKSAWFNKIIKTSASQKMTSPSHHFIVNLDDFTYIIKCAFSMDFTNADS